MVNLIAQRRLVPELLQGRFTAANVASALAPLLADGPERDRQLTGLAEVRARLTLGGADSPSGADSPRGANSPIDRVAAAVLALLVP
jgi:lipid-A-disaccharide synthase